MAGQISNYDDVDWSSFKKSRMEPDLASVTVSATMSCVSPEARSEFQRLERGYYAYWMGRIGCDYKGWNANLQSHFSKKCIGCLECQEQTYRQLTTGVGTIKYWDIIHVTIPLHHAVAVVEKGKRITDGYFFDPWPTQNPVVYTFDNWPFSSSGQVQKE